MERLFDLTRKQVVRLDDGVCLGRATDLEIDIKNGRIEALVIPGKFRLFGLLGREAETVVPWPFVRQIGNDVILVRVSTEK